MWATVLVFLWTLATANLLKQPTKRQKDFLPAVANKNSSRKLDTRFLLSLLSSALRSSNGAGSQKNSTAQNKEEVKGNE